jgi:hypothetical protein
MSDFTTLVNRGIRRYVDKYLKRREFGRCEECGARALLVRLTLEEDGSSEEFGLCNGCYDEFVQETIE